MTVGVVGLGLIGGSIGLGMRSARHTVLGVETDPKHAKTAMDRGCADEIVPLDRAARADVVFVAVPPGAAVSAVRDVLKARATETVVTDCTSVKAEVVAAAGKEPMFVPGHPMAGHEKSGPAFATAWMFRNARWLLTPTKKTSKAAVKSVEELVKSLGATPVRIDAETHDRHVAILSHLPHALAGVLVGLGGELERTDIVGGSWRDLTRVGGVDPELWAQIFLGNRAEIGRVLSDSIERLSGLHRALEESDEAAVRAFFESARMAKEKHES